MTRVVVAMSGGVDSSVAAALLIQQGFEVIGMMMRLWSEPGTENENRCCTPDAMSQARRVASMLGIPFYAIDAQDIFYKTVVKSFIDGYAQGSTPNPCLVCNRHIRWEFLLQHALAVGADFMATGHYVRLERDSIGLVSLRKAADSQKDQSYVLHVLTQDQLKHALFPLGEYTKPEVRQLARDFKLPVAERAESQDLCFLGSEDYRSFLLRNAPQVNNPGPIISNQGEHLGEHQGLASYTIGQRKGLGISSPVPLYVLGKDPQNNALIVGEQSELGSDELTAVRVNWISGAPPAMPARVQIKIRYKAEPAWGWIGERGDKSVHVKFDNMLRDISPGQAAVFYQDDLVLGGGTILNSGSPE